MLEQRTIITAPEPTYAPNGKILPVARIAIVDAIFDGDTQVGKGKVHYGSLAMQPDGSWAFAVEPIHPATNKPFAFSETDKARWDAVLDVYEERFGVVDHELPGGKKVTYTPQADGTFARAVA